MPLTLWSLRWRSDFARRARLYRAFHADPVIHQRTAFFAAAASICEVFAHAPATPFLAEISTRLESFNVDCAVSIRNGALYSSTNTSRNTLDFIAAEQALVDENLRGLRTRNLPAFRSELRSLNLALSVAATGTTSAVATPTLCTLVHAIHQVRLRQGRLPRYEKLEDRVLIGGQLAFASASENGAG